MFDLEIISEKLLNSSEKPFSCANFLIFMLLKIDHETTGDHYQSGKSYTACLNRPPDVICKGSKIFIPKMRAVRLFLTMDFLYKNRELVRESSHRKRGYTSHQTADAASSLLN